MSEDRMQGIQRYRLAYARRDEITSDGLVADAKGPLVRYEDASRALQKLRDALEELFALVNHAHPMMLTTSHKARIEKAIREAK